MRSAPCVSRSANKQRLDRGHLARVRPVGDVFGLDAVRGKVTDQPLGQLGQRAGAQKANPVTFLSRSRIGVALWRRCGSHRASEPILAKRAVNENGPPKEAAHIALNWRSLRARNGNRVVLDQPSRSRRSRCPSSPRSTTRERCQRYRLCRLRRRASRSS
jgi:hypothetical protein